MKKLFLFLGAAVLLAGCGGPSAGPVDTPGGDAPEAVNSWQVVGTSGVGQPVYYAGFLDEAFGVTVGYGGDVRYSTDGGATWAEGENSSMCRFGLEVVDEQTAWNCGNGGHVRLSTDGGRTWQPVTNFGPSAPNHCRFLSFLDATTGWAAAPSLLGMTADGGETWQEIVLPEGVTTIAAIHLRTPRDGYLLDADGRLFVTSDGGASWSGRALDFTAEALLMRAASPTVVLRFVDEQRGMIVLPRGSADEGYAPWSAYTEDGGASWRLDRLPVEGGLPFLFLSRDLSVLTLLDTVARQVTVLRFQVP